MPRTVWLTDVHLNFPPHHEVDAFLRHVSAAAPTAVLLGGDIAEYPDCLGYLERFAERLSCPLYFVLGNHDYYFTSIRKLRSEARELCDRKPNLHYLSEAGAFEIAPGVGLIGHDGWGDGRYGDYMRSVVSMQDHRLIEELSGHSKAGRRPILWQLGDEAARHVHRTLSVALAQFAHVVLLTHVPPFRESCRYEGALSDDHWVPYFACKAVGQTILEAMRLHPDRKLTVLCGHTHGAAEYHPLPNLEVITAAAKYGHPEIARTFDW